MSGENTVVMLGYSNGEWGKYCSDVMNIRTRNTCKRKTKRIVTKLLRILFPYILAHANLVRFILVLRVSDNGSRIALSPY